MLNTALWNDERPWLDIVASRRKSSRNLTLEDNPLLPLYGPLIDCDSRPDSFVMAQLGQSLDGRIATASGHSHYINGRSALIHLHRLRALADAVIIGVGTALADNPALTVRHATGPSPARIIIDPNSRLTLNETCLTDSSTRRIVLRRGETATDITGPEGVEILTVPGDDTGTLSPHRIIARLAEAGLTRLLVEGGAHTVSAFLAAGALDRMHFLVGPMIIGSGPAGLTLPVIETLNQAIRPTIMSYSLPEGDMLIDCAFTGTEGEK